MSSNHIQIFNPKPELSGPFTQFGRLPLELRLYVWSLVLTQERFLRVLLQSAYNSSVYSIVIKGSRTFSKLFHINKESRQVAHQFYPVKIPCYYSCGEDGLSLREGTFYFHPELDVLWLDPGRFAHGCFSWFLSDLRNSDIQGRGLRNVALSGNNVNKLEDIRMSELSDAHQAALKSAMESLDNVYFMSTENAGRVHLGYFGGIPAIREYEVHRSKPIMPLTPRFTRLPFDPRPNIDYDLSKVFVGTFDPRAMIFHWRKLLQKWGAAVPDGQTEHYLLVSQARSEREHGAPRESAEQWLESEHAAWLRSQEKFRTLIEKEGLAVPLESEKDLEKTTKTAVGFWLFPVAALGNFPDLQEEYHWGSRHWQPKRVLDLRESRPQLCLADLPGINKPEA